MAQWWEHSPPTTVARVIWFLDPASHVGWVCCWFLSLLRGFSSIRKNQHSKCQFDLRIWSSCQNACYKYSTDQKKPNRERLTERVLVAVPQAFPFPFHTRSVPVPYPFSIWSVLILPVFHLWAFLELVQKNEVSENSFTRMLPISNTQLKLSPYVCVQEIKQKTYIFLVKMWVQLLEKCGKRIAI